MTKEEINHPLVSIIVPVYKAENCIRRCLASIYEQTFKDFEAVLVDDGSPDRAGSICDEIANQDSRFRVIHKNNGGISDARNTGLESARGKYICFLDDDDYISPLFLYNLFNLIEGGADIAVCQFCKVAENVNDYFLINKEQPVFIDTLSVDAFLSGLSNDQTLMMCWNKMYRREIIGEERFRSICVEDADFNYRIGLKKPIVQRSSFIGYAYRTHPGCTTLLDLSKYMVESGVSRCRFYAQYLHDYENDHTKATTLWALHKLILRIRWRYSRGKDRSYIKDNIRIMEGFVHGDFLHCKGISFFQKATYAVLIRSGMMYKMISHLLRKLSVK